MKKIVVLLMVFLTNCEETPGIAEPNVFFCTLLNLEIADCQHSIDPGTHHDMNTIDMIGYTCVSPRHLAEIKTHHAVLHDKINK